MPSARGWIVLITGLFLWIAARLVGSPTLHMAAVGLVLVPILSWIFVWRNRHRLVATRRLSHTSVGLGTNLTVEVVALVDGSVPITQRAKLSVSVSR